MCDLLVCEGQVAVDMRVVCPQDVKNVHEASHNGLLEPIQASTEM